MFGSQPELVYTHFLFLFFDISTMGLKAWSMLISNWQFTEIKEESAENPLLRDAVSTHHGGSLLLSVCCP